MTPQAALAPYPYDGPEPLREPILAALREVVDPEVALSIVDIGLVYGVTVTPTRVHLSLTMTSAACPVADVVVDDAAAALERIAPAGTAVDVELVWEPPWTPARISARARAFLGG